MAQSLRPELRLLYIKGPFETDGLDIIDPFDRPVIAIDPDKMLDEADQDALRQQAVEALNLLLLESANGPLRDAAMQGAAECLETIARFFERDRAANIGGWLRLHAAKLRRFIPAETKETAQS